jgi:hypothetical protein
VSGGKRRRGGYGAGLLPHHRLLLIHGLPHGTLGGDSGVTVGLQCCYSVVTVLFIVLLQCCYSIVTVVLQCCHSVVTVLLQCCYSVVTVLLSIATVLSQCC